MRSMVGKKDVFLSYAHRNIDFARKIRVGSEEGGGKMRGRARTRGRMGERGRKERKELTISSCAVASSERGEVYSMDR